MKLTGALLVVTAAALALAGCGSSPDPPRTSLPKPSDFGLSEQPATTAITPSPETDVRFLTLLNVRNVPYAGTTPAQDASLVCSNLASGDTWEQVVARAPFTDEQQRRWWTLTAVEVYCPELG